MKNFLSALISDSTQNKSLLLQICKNIGVTHWVNPLNTNAIRTHFRKHGPTNIALLDERIGTEWGVNLAQELKQTGCKNIVLFINKTNSTFLTQVIQKGNRGFVFKKKIKQTYPNWKLTKREIRILQSLSLGKNLNEIASSLHVSVSQVKKDLCTIRKKTKIYDRAEIVATALRAGVIG